MEPVDLDGMSEVNMQSTTQSKKGGSKRNRKSQFWEHFAEILDDKNNTSGAICNYCELHLSINSKNGTSSMKKHLATCKKYPLNLINVDKKQKLISVFRTAQSDAATISNWEFDNDATRFALAKMIIIDEQPFSMVEREGFRLFCSVGVPQFHIPSRFTVARDCKKIYVCEKSNLKKGLKCLKSRISLTTDCWSSNQNFNYMCLTAHFIDDDWKLHKRILNFRLMDSHKGKEIGIEVESCLDEWGIEDKISCVTVDNASSNDLAIAHLKTNLCDKLVSEGEYFHMRCSAHVLNLIVRDGLSMVKDSLCKIRGAVKYVRSSPSRASLFDKCAKLVKVPYKGSVCLDVSTRWNSTYLMLESALKFQKVFKRCGEDDADFAKELKDGVPEVNDWENARTLATCLKTFYESTKRMSGSLYVTSNMHFHEILGIVSTLKVWETSSDEKLRTMGSQMRAKFDKYYGVLGKTNMMVLIAVVLDPRYKLKFVKFALKKIYSEDISKADQIGDRVTEALFNLFTFYVNVYKSANVDVTRPINVNNGAGKNDEGEPLDQIYDDFEVEEHEDEGDRSELEIYLDAVRERKDDSFDILKWWRSNCGTYKVLGLMARDILAIPVSTVSSESAFSTSGRVLDQFRSSLGPKTVEVLICAQDWLRTSPMYIDIENIMADVEKYEEELTDGGLTDVEDILGDSN